MTTILFAPSSGMNGGNLFGNLDLNFRSLFNNESILQHIMRLSEMDRGRSGTPPASAEVIKNLPVVEITEKDCK